MRMGMATAQRPAMASAGVSRVMRHPRTKSQNVETSKRKKMNAPAAISGDSAIRRLDVCSSPALAPLDLGVSAGEEVRQRGADGFVRVEAEVIEAEADRRLGDGVVV